MKQAVRFLTQEIDYDVPVQGLSVSVSSLSSLPALPKSRFVIRQVRQTR